MDSILEDKRSLHEERDRIEQAIVSEMLTKKSGHREKLDSEHRQKILLERYMKCSKHLLELYEQPQMVQPEESATSTFNDFYLAIKEIKDYYKHSNDQVVTMAYEAAGINVLYSGDGTDDLEADGQDDDNQDEDRSAEKCPLNQSQLEQPTKAHRVEKLVEFTDEEGYGRYLDLIKCHEAFLQLVKRQEVKPNYLTFLDKFDRFTDLDREQKLTPSYRTYVEMLLSYFRDYCARAKPLFDYKDMEQNVHEKFIQDWNNKTFPGWFCDSDRMVNSTDSNPMIDLETYKDHNDLMELGLDCLKQELQVRGLKCGGTLEDRAKRLFSVKGKRQDEIDDSLRSNPIIKKCKRRNNIDPFYIASIEAKLTMYAEYFSDQRLATIENVQRKQARTAEERNESDEDISDVDDDDPNQADVVYNPKNLPLGWDGKPIPYWLYKLHGLNLTFNCEICGNATYKGPKTFQRHFVEWRHAHGMKCLGIPNSAHFAYITKIQEAINLWNKLKSERQKDKFQPMNEEEYEDTQGNVVNKKTYEDLKRQGLL